MSSLLLLNRYVEEVVAGYAVGSISLILIGISLLIFLYRIQKWIINVNDNMSYLEKLCNFINKYKKRKKKKQRIIKRILLHQTMKNLRQKVVMFKNQLKLCAMNIVFMYN